MRLIIDQSLAAGLHSHYYMAAEGFIAFKPGKLERKVYNNDDITFFSVFRGERCKTSSHSDLENINTQEKNVLSSY